MCWISFFILVQFKFSKSHFFKKSIFEIRNLVKSCGVYWGKAYHVWLFFRHLCALKCAETCWLPGKVYKNVLQTYRGHSLRFGKSFRRIGCVKGNEIVKKRYLKLPHNPTFWRFPLYMQFTRKNKQLFNCLFACPFLQSSTLCLWEE